MLEIRIGWSRATCRLKPGAVQEDRMIGNVLQGAGDEIILNGIAHGKGLLTARGTAGLLPALVRKGRKT